MIYDITRKSGAELDALITVKKDDWQKLQTDAFRMNGRRYPVNGFRACKAPMSIVKQKYGEGCFYGDAIEKAAEEFVSRLRRREEYRIYATTALDVVEANADGAKFRLGLAEYPKVELGRYVGLGIKEEIEAASDEDVMNRIDLERRRRARHAAEEGAIEAGDEVDIDYRGTIDGVEFKGGTAEKRTAVIGSKTFVDGFEEGLIGMKKGDEKEIAVKFPDDYADAEVAGKNATFAVRVNGVRRIELPEFDDEFVKDVDDEANSVEEYKAKVRAKIEEENKAKADNALKSSIVEKIVEGCKFDIPDAVLEDRVEEAVARMKKTIERYYGAKFEDYLAYAKMTESDLREKERNRVERELKTSLALGRIADVAGLNLTDEEAGAAIEKAMSESGDKADFQSRENALNAALADKILDFLAEKNRAD